MVLTANMPLMCLESAMGIEQMLAFCDTCAAYVRMTRGLFARPVRATGGKEYQYFVSRDLARLMG